MKISFVDKVWYGLVAVLGIGAAGTSTGARAEVG